MPLAWTDSLDPQEATGPATAATIIMHHRDEMTDNLGRMKGNMCEKEWLWALVVFTVYSPLHRTLRVTVPGMARGALVWSPPEDWNAKLQCSGSSLIGHVVLLQKSLGSPDVVDVIQIIPQTQPWLILVQGTVSGTASGP